MNILCYFLTTSNVMNFQKNWGLIVCNFGVSNLEVFSNIKKILFALQIYRESF